MRTNIPVSSKDCDMAPIEGVEDGISANNNFPSRILTDRLKEMSETYSAYISTLPDKTDVAVDRTDIIYVSKK